MSTKAPKAVTLVTTPSSCIPSREVFERSGRRRGTWAARTSRADRGPASSARRRCRAASARRRRRRRTLPVDAVDERRRCRRASRRPTPRSVAIARRARSARDGRRCRRAGAPPRMRRKPAHCSNARAPRPRTSRSALREAKAPRSLRCSTMRRASTGPMPETCSSSCARGRVRVDADQVHAPLDDLAELLAQQRLVDVVLVLPDADRSSDRSSPARRADPAGGVRWRWRRAAERSRSGNSSRATSDAE